MLHVKEQFISFLKCIRSGAFRDEYTPVHKLRLQLLLPITLALEDFLWRLWSVPISMSEECVEHSGALLLFL